MGKVYITFDNYYNVDQYNEFLSAAKNNNIEYEEFLRIRAPFNRYLYIEESNVPKFLNYDLAAANDIKWLVSIVKPVRNNEAYLLRRREGQDVSYFNYILPIPLKDAHTKKYIMFFKGQDISVLNQYSSQIHGVKIYKLGRADLKGFNIYFCYSKYIQGVVPKTKVLLEFDGDVPQTPGDLEYLLNVKVLVKEKLMNKTLELDYHLDGKYVPIKKRTFL